MAYAGKSPKYPGIRITSNGSQLVSGTESLAAEAGVFYPITPSTEMGEFFQNSYAKGELNAFGKSLTAIEAEGEHAAQGGAITMSVTGKRVVNFTSGQGIAYGVEQYYHAPGKLSTMVLEVGARGPKSAAWLHHTLLWAVPGRGHAWRTCWLSQSPARIQAAHPTQAALLGEVYPCTLHPTLAPPHPVVLQSLHTTPHRSLACHRCSALRMKPKPGWTC